MTTITGIIEDLPHETKSIKGEQKEIHYLVIAGKKYNVGFYPANYGGKKNPASIGDEVTFESEYKFGENKCDYTTLRKTGGAVAKGAVSNFNAAPVSSGLALRSAALNAASRVPHDLQDANSVIEIAKKFESYLQGE